MRPNLLIVVLLLTLAPGLVPGPTAAEPAFWKHEFPLTDFSRTSVTDWTEIRDGGPGRDGIPALSDPKFIPVAEENRLGAREPVIALEIDGAVPRAYPLRYLTWHEIVNDTVGGVPVAVTFCPLCNSAPVFDRRVDRTVLHFGVSGKLRNSDMVMYDRESESFWQQAVGQGIVGKYTGAQLTQLVSWTEAWADFVARNPDGLVMDEPDYTRSYGTNPYVGYDSRTRPYPFYTGDDPPHGIPALERVLAVGNRAWPLSRLRSAGTLHEAGLDIEWVGEQASALDSRRISKGRGVGSIRVRDGRGRDVAHDVMFAFAFHAFHPDGEWMLGDP